MILAEAFGVEQFCQRVKIFAAIPNTQMIVDVNGTLVMANALASSLLGLHLKDIGRPLQDLKISYRPVELRSQIEQVYTSRSALTLSDVAQRLPTGETQYFDVQLVPLKEDSGDLLGVSIIFVDISRYYQLQRELLRSTQELETTNEELQSSNEELETTNEELQSTNEELETINEEQQSTNEELQTMNDEMRSRTLDLNQSNEFLYSILSSLQMAVAVVDQQYNLLAWNHEAENLWCLREEEVKGNSLLSLDTGLPVGQLREPVRDCLTDSSDHQEITLKAVNRRGLNVQCRISFSPLNGYNKERRGVIVLMEVVKP